MKIVSVVGARPNFMKIAPIILEIGKHNQKPLKSSERINHILVHTGQHYDAAMSDAFFTDLNLPKPDISLGVGSGSHAEQTAEIMKRFEKVLLREKPDIMIVVGDVNSTLACALVASKISYDSNGGRPLIAHVEAGLRSFDRSMPEEVNRLVTDTLADLLFTPSEDADENLFKEGILKEKIKRVGNIMIDTLVLNLDKARERRTYEKFGLRKKDYTFVTLHRPSNVDNNYTLSYIIWSLEKLSNDLPVIFPVHPRTKKQLKSYGLWEKANKITGLNLVNPLGYHDSICLVDNSRFVLTDSGGLQEETTFLNIPCLTLRPNTERPITIIQGTNRLTSLETLERDFNNILNGYYPEGKIPELWDGKTAERIVEVLRNLSIEFDKRDSEKVKE
jgi:UDP-N-acetylglucosamine 2-epimerase (non-hydrolysing)